MKNLNWVLQSTLIISVMMEDMCFSAHGECFLASGREAHGFGFLSSRGSVIPVMIDLCSLSGDNKLKHRDQPGDEQADDCREDPTAAGSQV